MTTRALTPVAGAAFLAVSAMACGGVTIDDATHSLGASSSAESASVELRAPVAHLYFGPTNHLQVADDVVATMTLNAGALVELEVATADSSPLRFELWELPPGEKSEPELVNAFDASSGFVLTTFSAPVDGSYLLRFPAPASPREVNLELTCQLSDGRCTSELEPGEACTQTSVCSPGLVCAPSDGTCDASKAGGTCVIPGDDFACAGLLPGPVCGCDGITYGNECLAVAQGVGMRASGPCLALASSPPPPH